MAHSMASPKGGRRLTMFCKTLRRGVRNTASERWRRASQVESPQAPACAGCGVLPAPVVDGERVLCPECCSFKQANHVELTDYPGDEPC